MVSIVSVSPVGWSEVQILVGSNIINKTGSGLTKPLFQEYPGSVPGFKRTGCEVNHSCPSSAEVTVELYLYAPSTPS
jgi:hypothetical protein